MFVIVLFIVGVFEKNLGKFLFFYLILLVTDSTMYNVPPAYAKPLGVVKRALSRGTSESCSWSFQENRKNNVHRCSF
jgi:hypothetical protein